MNRTIYATVKIQISETENGWLVSWERKPKGEERSGIGGRVEVLRMCIDQTQLTETIIRATKDIKE